MRLFELFCVVVDRVNAVLCAWLPFLATFLLPFRKPLIGPITAFQGSLLGLDRAL